MKRPLQYWQKIYLASLALFLGGLCAGFFAVLNISCRQSFAARTGELLAGQHTLAVTLANDMAVVMASRPEALDLLWQETGRAARSEGLALAVWRGGAPRYSLLAINDLPELETLQPGQRSWQVRLVEGRHLFFATTALAGDLTGYAVTVQADMEDFYTEWRRTGAVFLSLGSAVGAAFAAGLYLVLRRMNRPLQALTETARALAAGDYARRAAAPGAPPRRDEVGELARVLDQLAGRVQAQLRQLAEEAAAKQRLVDDLSHEMRTPLTAIGGWSETLLAGGGEDPEEVMQGLTIIQKESNRLTRMVEELLDFARIESGRMKLEVELFDLSIELYEAAYMYENLLQKSGIRLSYDEDVDANYYINGDRHRMKQVFLNILDNAAKYGADGKKIDIVLRRDGGKIVVSVRDYGQGIPEAELPFVKEKFYKGSSKQRGSGIGLAVTDEIVTLHGGTLDIASTLGAGTTVTVTLPAAEAEEALGITGAIPKIPDTPFDPEGEN